MTNELATRFDFSDGFTHPTPVSHDKILVNIAPSTIAETFSKALVHECNRVSPKIFLQTPITVEEVTNYIKYLLKMRCKQVNCESIPWRKLKLLWVPDYIEMVLSQIGLVELREYGLTIQPVYEGDVAMTDEEAYLVSEKLADFMDKPLHLGQNSLPTDVKGDTEVMSCALIAETVVGMRPDYHPAATYVAAFANLQLMKESAFSALYRVKYDDISIIADALWSGRVKVV